MARVKKVAVEPNTLKRPKVSTVNSATKVRIRTNMKTTTNRKICDKIVKTVSASPPTALLLKVTECGIKLKRFKLPEGKSSSSFQHNPLNVSEKSKVRKCVVKIMRLAPEDVIQSRQSTGSKVTKGIIENLNNIKDNMGSTNFQLRSILKKGRQPFKEINVQEMQVDTHPVITRERREQLRKLSLTSGNREPMSNDISKEKDILRFEPLRNSTLHEFGFKNIENENAGNLNNIKIVERIKDRATESEVFKTTSNNKQSSHILSKAPNLLNKSDLIEEILNNDDENPITVDQTSQKNTHKFFHRSVNPSQKGSSIRNQPEKTKIEKTTRISRSNVYDFLSLSQTSDSDSTKKDDPMADIIKKLIDEDKVTVATHKKGTGKLQIKRKLSKKQTVTKSKKPRVLKKKNKKNEDKTTVPQTTAPTNEIESLEDPGIPSTVHSNSKRHNDSSTGGSFSNLARSVLISQAGKSQKLQKKLTDQRKLLEVARKFVSTPVNKKLPPLDKNAMPSPIIPEPTYIGSASPWRVDEDQNLPNIFYFSRNSDNLPSFSSDFIPSTPKKQSSVVNTLVRDSFTPLRGVAETSKTTPLNSSLKNNQSIMPSLHSSYSSNDSNAENLSPPSSTQHVTRDKSVDENATVLNLRQQSNPRRALKYRSPLKPINILEVISLPPWKSSVKDNSKRDGAEINLTSKTDKSECNDNLFGFEDFLEDGEDKELSTPIRDQSGNKSLSQKLQALKHFRPKEIPKLTKPKLKRGLFDEHDTGNQRLINDMLCSTMINPPRCNMDSALNNQQSLFDNNDENTTNELSQLFKDPEPELTFNEKDPHRTYVRPFKRKRKLRHNFVMFLDSDDSGDEGNDGHDNDDEKVTHKKKKPREDPKDIDDLNSFVNDFNDMCKEVDQYELLVE